MIHFGQNILEIPPPLIGCTINNMSTEHIIVTCVEHKSHLPPDKYHLELWTNDTEVGSLQIVSNISVVTQPYFTVFDVKPATRYRIAVYASNQKGAGNKFWLEGETPDVPKVERSKGM